MIFGEDADLPFWKQLARHLRERMVSGELSPGHPLPAESELMSEFGCSRTTVRRAVAQLRAEGLLVIDTPSGGGVRHLVRGVRTVTVRAGDSFSSVAPISVTRADGSFDIYPAGTVIRRA